MAGFVVRFGRFVHVVKRQRTGHQPIGDFASIGSGNRLGFGCGRFFFLVKMQRSGHQPVEGIFFQIGVGRLDVILLQRPGHQPAKRFFFQFGVVYLNLLLVLRQFAARWLVQQRQRHISRQPVIGQRTLGLTLRHSVHKAGLFVV